MLGIIIVTCVYFCRGACTSAWVSNNLANESQSPSKNDIKVNEQTVDHWYHIKLLKLYIIHKHHYKSIGFTWVDQQVYHDDWILVGSCSLHPSLGTHHNLTALLTFRSTNRQWSTWKMVLLSSFCAWNASWKVVNWIKRELRAIRQGSCGAKFTFKELNPRFMTENNYSLSQLQGIMLRIRTVFDWAS